MAPVVTPEHPVAGRPEQRATRLVFLVAGFATAAWAPLVPFAKARAGIDDGTLGLLLLCLGAGSIAAMPVAGALAARVGCRAVILASAVPLCLVLPPLAVVSGPLSLGVALLVFGASIGAIDVAMNIQAVLVERAAGRPMMSGFHAFYSLGGLAGSAAVTALLAIGASPFQTTSCAAAALVAVLLLAARTLLPYGGGRGGPAFAVPRGAVLLLGALCFVAFLSEAAVLDWGAVFLTSVRGLEANRAGLGYAAFSLAMTVCRFAGDRAVVWLGGTGVVLFGGFVGALGFAVATLVPFWPVTLLGYALVGIGCANVVPVLFTSAGRQTAVPEHVAVSAVTTLGYAGILTGPAAIGLVAREAGLPMAFLLLAVLQLCVAASGRLIRP